MAAYCSSGGGWVTMSATPFAKSIGEPPPSATIAVRTRGPVCLGCGQDRVFRRIGRRVEKLPGALRQQLAYLIDEALRRKPAIADQKRIRDPLRGKRVRQSRQRTGPELDVAEIEDRAHRPALLRRLGICPTFRRPNEVHTMSRGVSPPSAAVSAYPTCSTAREPAGSGFRIAFADVDGSSQAAQSARSRTAICRS